MSSKSWKSVAGLLTAVAAALTVGVTPATTMAAATPAVPAAVPALAVPGAPDLGYKDEDGNVIPDPSGGVVAFSGCTPVSGRDNPHYSSPDVSGHGWWDKGTCTNNTAYVYNCLYEYYTDGYWYRKTCSSKVILKPYSVSSNRTTARATCNNTLPASWRNHVDVDVINEADTAEEPYNQADVYCQVF